LEYGSVQARYKFAMVLAVFVVVLSSTIIAAQPSVFILNTGVIVSPQPRIVYVFKNATATYELNSTFQVITQNTNSLTVLNHAISDASQLKGSLFVYNGTYQVSGTINMNSNVNMTLQDGVFINETGSNVYIFSFSSVSNSSVFANSNATIHGVGAPGYDMEEGFYLENCYNVTISASQPNGLKVYNIGALWMYGRNINNSLFQNLYGYKWQQMYLYQNHGMLFDGLNNVQLINITSDGLGGDSRCALCIGGAERATNNVTIIGGLYENSYYDNGIYLGGWEKPVTNIRIINVTTAFNNPLHTGHSGLKFRPACNVTVINWTSNYDNNGMEMDTVYDSESSTYLTGGSWYNNVTGTINYPYNSGLTLDVDGTNKNQSVMYNTFNLAVNNASQTSIWIDNEYPPSSQVSYNTIYLNSTGGQKQAISFSGAGTSSYNTVYGWFIQNGKGMFPDISFYNLSSQNYNIINVYSTVGNPNGLYTGSLGTNVVNYPYT
jgi:hypothetical protein